MRCERSTLCPVGAIILAQPMGLNLPRPHPFVMNGAGIYIVLTTSDEALKMIQTWNMQRTSAQFEVMHLTEKKNQQQRRAH